MNIESQTPAVLFDSIDEKLFAVSELKMRFNRIKLLLSRVDEKTRIEFIDGIMTGYCHFCGAKLPCYCQREE